MDPLQLPQLPENYVKFAEAIAAVADSHGIKEFKMNFPIHYSDDLDRFAKGHQIKGNIDVYYSSTDQRGRPSRTLTMGYNADVRCFILDEPES